MKCRGILDSLLWCWWANKDDLYRRSLHGASSESTWMKQTEHDDKWKWWVFVCVSWERERMGQTQRAQKQLQNWFICVRKRSSVRVCVQLYARYTPNTHMHALQYIQFIQNIETRTLNLQRTSFEPLDRRTQEPPFKSRWRLFKIATQIHLCLSHWTCSSFHWINGHNTHYTLNTKHSNYSMRCVFV